MFFNVTDHAVTIERLCGERFTIEPSGPVARVVDHRRLVNEVDEIPVRLIEEQEIIGLPAPVPGRVYIASMMVARAAAAQGRTDVLSPDTSLEGAVRGRGNKVQRVRGLQMFPFPGALA